MSRISRAERLQRLTERRDQINAQLSQLEARTKKQERRIEDRKKFLIGALILSDLPNQPALRKYLSARLPAFLTRPDDRGLFAELLPQVVEPKDEPNSLEGP